MKKIIIVILLAFLISVPPVIANFEPTEQSLSLPLKFSWRDINGTDFTTPAKNQAPAPLCEAYALCGALEALIQYKVGYNFGCDLSEAHLFFYANGTALWGVNVQEAANYLLEHGVPDEGCFPDARRCFDTPFESLDGWENRTVKITEWGWVDNRIENIKQALVEHGPLVICMLTRNDFFRYKRGIYIPHGPVKGGHVITIFGYDDEQRYWEVKNSGGTDWGEDGWIRVSYDAHTPDHPFFWPFYGGTGILYIDGVYGNFQPDVPQITIDEPEFYHTYLRGRKLPTFFSNLRFIQKGVPRIIGSMMVQVSVVNTDSVEFFVDGESKFIDDQRPFEWEFHDEKGLHTIEVFAYNEHNVSKAISDVHVLR